MQALDGDYKFDAFCDMVGKTIYCSIDTDIENAEFAFYVILDGERKATFWYTDRPNVEYICGDEIINKYEIVFFIRYEGEKIISKTITKKTNWSICDGVIEAVRNLVSKDCTIVELGSGMGSKSLAEICTVYSIEHDERFLELHDSVNYIHAPLVEIEPFPEFDEFKWYDAQKVRENLPSKIDLILVDGPPEKYGRSGILNHLDMFGKSCIWIVDDILREKDQKLANYIALKFGHIQYRFWNFSIIASPCLQIKNLEAIYDVALLQLQLKSDYYVSKFYPSI
jgi:hypothetical protein